MGYNIATDSPLSTPSRTDISSWIGNYKDNFIEHSHDQSMLSLVTPDDSLFVVGPPRLSGGDQFYIVGLINTCNYSESAQVQPMKAIGSRRHIFSKTNAPVQGQIGRMMVLGNNLYRALYALTNFSDKVKNRNPNFAVGDNGEESSWYTNLETDIFRYPFGMGIIYNSPASAAEDTASSAGAEYLEICTLQNRNVSFQAGQAMVMEQVSFFADRVVPWHAYAGPTFDAGSFANDVGSFIG